MPTPLHHERPQISDREKAILDQRLKTVEEDAKAARPAAEVLAELRAKLKPVPR